MNWETMTVLDSCISLLVKFAELHCALVLSRTQALEEGPMLYQCCSLINWIPPSKDPTFVAKHKSNPKICSRCSAGKEICRNLLWLYSWHSGLLYSHWDSHIDLNCHTDRGWLRNTEISWTYLLGQIQPRKEGIQEIQCKQDDHIVSEGQGHEKVLHLYHCTTVHMQSFSADLSAWKGDQLWEVCSGRNWICRGQWTQDLTELENWVNVMKYDEKFHCIWVSL